MYQFDDRKWKQLRFYSKYITTISYEIVTMPDLSRQSSFFKTEMLLIIDKLDRVILIKLFVDY